MTLIPVTIDLPSGMYERLCQLADTMGKTVSEVVREALDCYCANHGSSSTRYDVARQAGFLGAVEGGPDDLSFNPKHMEGFGRT